MLRRIIVTAVIAVGLILVGPALSRIFFPILFLLGLFPNYVLLLLTLLLAPLAILAFRPSRVVSVGLTALFAAQAGIITLWLLGWTGASFYWNHSTRVGAIVLDPSIESYLMTGFWILVAIVLALGVEGIIDSFLASQSLFETRHLGLVALLICEVFLLSLMRFGRIGFVGSSERAAVSSRSPSGNREIRLLPMQSFMDTNGIVIQREQRSIVWRSVGQIGDLLTESSEERFIWSDESRVFLLSKIHGTEYPVIGFDFSTRKNIDPKDWRP